jgi:hypothetical protein
MYHQAMELELQFFDAAGHSVTPESPRAATLLPCHRDGEPVLGNLLPVGRSPAHGSVTAAVVSR